MYTVKQRFINRSNLENKQHKPSSSKRPKTFPFLADH